MWGRGTSYSHIKRLYRCICVSVCVSKGGFTCLPITGWESQYWENIIVFQCIHKFNGIPVQKKLWDFLRGNLRNIDLRKVNVFQ